MTHRRVLLVLLVLGGATVAPATAAADVRDGRTAASTTAASATAASTTAASASSHTLHRTLTLSLTPAEPGSIRVHAAFEIPDGVTQLTAIVPRRATVTDTTGFRQRSERRYEWQGTTDTPTITWRQSANRSGGGDRKGTTASGGVTFVDTGEWALVTTPQLAIRYSGIGSPPTVTRDVAVDGEGVAGTSMSYLGPYRERQRTAGGQSVRLVIPAAADMAESPDDVLDSLGAAAERLDMGGRDEEVVAFVAPTAGVEWGPPGLQRGPDEFWARDDKRVDRAGNIWVHEYVHTRQAARTTNSSRWLVEGAAEYYANYLTLRQGRIDFQAFRDHLAFGTRDAYRDAVLAEREDWRGTGANYWKGSLVAAAVDRQIRLATDRRRTLADVYRRLNGRENFTNAAFLDAVEAVAGPDVREYARRYTTTEAAPDLWDRHEHRVAFRSAANISTELTGLAVRGPYREAAVEAPVTVVPGERVVTRIRIRNVGTVDGTYTTILTKDGQRVAASTGRLAAGEETTVELETTLDTTGEHELAVGDETVAVTVHEPATPTVAHVAVPPAAAPGASVTVTATVHNDADRPAAGRVPVTVDGERVATRTVELAPGGSTTVTATVRLETTGDHTVGVGNATATVTVSDDARAATTDPGDTTTAPGGGTTNGTATPASTDGSGPGFGVLAGMAAVLAVATAARRAWERH